MVVSSSDSSLTDRIQQLHDQRQRHADAVAAIDIALAQISQILGAPIGAAKPTITAAPAAKPAKGRHVRGSFATTGKESILAFLKERGSATSSEIKQHWQSEGRKGKVENDLGKLFKARQLARTPLVGKPGNRYSLANAASGRAVATPAKARAVRKTYPITAEESILAFVKERGGATTQEIRKFWTGEGRPGVPDYVVSRMVAGRKLMRMPLGGKLGSRYTLP